jgi:hypothetical protein
MLSRRNPARGSLTYTNHTVCNKTLFGKVSFWLYKQLYQSEVLNLFTKDTARRSQGTLGGVSSRKAAAKQMLQAYAAYFFSQRMKILLAAHTRQSARIAQYILAKLWF